MSKRLTDADVAKALGWRRHVSQTDVWWNVPGRSDKGKFDFVGTPAFTTSLDAIVAEIEARKLHWKCETVYGGGGVILYYAGQVAGNKADDKTSSATALAKSLLAYLSEREK